MAEPQLLQPCLPQPFGISQLGLAGGDGSLHPAQQATMCQPVSDAGPGLGSSFGAPCQPGSSGSQLQLELSHSMPMADAGLEALAVVVRLRLSHSMPKVAEGSRTLHQRERCWKQLRVSWGASPMARYSDT